MPRRGLIRDVSYLPSRDVSYVPTLGKGGGWWDNTALLDMDLTNSRFRFDGQTLDKASFLTAIGGSETGGVYTIGPYVDPAGADLVTNGDFTTDVTGWSAANGTIAQASGQLELTGGGAASASAYQQITKATNRGIRLRGTLTRVTGGPGVALALAGVTALSGTSFQSSFLGATETPTQFDVLYGGDEFATLYAGIKQNGASTGKSRLDNVEAKYAVPFDGVDYTVLSARVTGIMPASASGNKVLLQFGDDTERNRIRLVWDATGNLRLITTYNNTEQSNIDLGVVAGSAAFDVNFSVQSNLVLAQLDGGLIQQDVAAGMPGVIKMWVRRSVTGETFDGTISRAQVWTEYMPASALWLEGDSYVAGSADLTSLWASIQTQTGRAAFYTGAGGSTLTNQKDRVVAHTGFAARNKLIHWDGQANGYGTLEQDMAKYAAMAAVKPDGKYLFLPPVVGPSTAADVITATEALAPAILSAYPDNSYDIQAFINALSSPWQGDGVHLTDTAMDAVANQLDSLGLLAA